MEVRGHPQISNTRGLRRLRRNSAGHQIRSWPHHGCALHSGATNMTLPVKEKSFLHMLRRTFAVGVENRQMLLYLYHETQNVCGLPVGAEVNLDKNGTRV